MKKTAESELEDVRLLSLKDYSVAGKNRLWYVYELWPSLVSWYQTLTTRQFKILKTNNPSIFDAL